MNEFESLAMWKLYAAHHESVCIQSTYEKLARLLPEQCFLGTVNYIDYSSQFIDLDNALNYIVHKRKGFDHERELRAVLWTGADDTRDAFISIGGKGLLVPIDIGKLIETIFISPDSG
jgi:hypothetical protein